MHACVSMYLAYKPHTSLSDIDDKYDRVKTVTPFASIRSQSACGNGFQGTCAAIRHGANAALKLYLLDQNHLTKVWLEFVKQTLVYCAPTVASFSVQLNMCVCVCVCVYVCTDAYMYV